MVNSTEGNPPFVLPSAVLTGRAWSEQRKTDKGEDWWIVANEWLSWGEGITEEVDELWLTLEKRGRRGDCLWGWSRVRGEDKWDEGCHCAESRLRGQITTARRRDALNGQLFNSQLWLPHNAVFTHCRATRNYAFAGSDVNRESSRWSASNIIKSQSESSWTFTSDISINPYLCELNRFCCEYPLKNT